MSLQNANGIADKTTQHFLLLNLYKGISPAHSAENSTEVDFQTTGSYWYMSYMYFGVLAISKNFKSLSNIQELTNKFYIEVMVRVHIQL